jgi:putative oxidoreductase
VSFGESIAPLFGRLVLSWFYFTQAYRYTRDWNDTTQFLMLKNLPAAPVFLFISLMGIVLGGLSLLLGFRTRIGALTLFTITVAATIIMHDYWTLQTAAARTADYDIFARNIAIAGGLLVLIGMGGGRFGMDNVGGKPPGRGGPPRR